MARSSSSRTPAVALGLRGSTVGRPRPLAAGASDHRLAASISAWFKHNARDLPWRTRPRDPYHSLVAEAMLQQTQVSRVLERYQPFFDHFPTVHALAAADEHDILAAWSGLGYYRRARSLHAAARMIVSEFAGRVPRDPADLARLPGVGRYTAGAIASIAFNRPAPIVDGNVARVLLRLHGRDAASDDRSIQPWLWQRAGDLVAAADSPAILNEGLMELGATVCLPAPAAPRCDVCPLREFCVARRTGRQSVIPLPKTPAARQNLFCAVAVVQRADGAILVERREHRGMWHNLWQAPTLERPDRPHTRAELARTLRLPARELNPAPAFEFLATHRRIMFEVFGVDAPRNFQPPRGEFHPRARIAALPLSSPQRRILLGA